MTTTARTPYWFWFGDSAVTEIAHNFHQPGGHDQKKHGRRGGINKLSLISAQEFISGEDPEKIHDAIVESYADWRRHLPHPMRAALASYQAGNYRSMNALARGIGMTETRLGPTVQDMKNKILNMDKALLEAPKLPKDMTLFRGISSGVFDDVEDPSNLIGSRFMDSGFVSTTFNGPIAKKFTLDRTLDGPPAAPEGVRKAIMRISAPEGSNAAYLAKPISDPFIPGTATPKFEKITDLTGFMDRWESGLREAGNPLFLDEVVFPRNTRFRVVDVGRNRAAPDKATLFIDTFVE